MNLRFLGGATEVGRSALLVNDRLLIDYGIKTGPPPAYPVGDVDPEAVVLSHGHLDHVGAVPALYAGTERPPVHLTAPTAALTRVLAKDTLKLHGGTPNCPFTRTDLQRFTGATQRHQYRESFQAAGHEVTFYNAGHIPGSAHVLIDDGTTRLLYTGDFNTEDQQLVAGSTARPTADIVITETTYSDVTREPRSQIEAEFVQFVEETIWEGGTVLIPAFAIGRTQEILALLAGADIDCYVDGMGKRVARLLAEHPAYVDVESLKAGTRHARFVNGRDGQRRRIADQNVAIVTTAGMLQGGPAMTYLPAIRSQPTNAIALVGYQVQGTPGRELLETGRIPINGRQQPVSARVRQFDLSAHADRTGLMEFLETYRSTPIVTNHGDRTAAFAAELQEAGYDARVPELGVAMTV